MASKIDVTRTIGVDCSFYEKNDSIQKREDEIIKIVQHLSVSNAAFDSGKVFEEILQYVIGYGRIFYSTISNIIYAEFEQSNGKESDKMGTLQSNLDALVLYSENEEVIANKKKSLRGNQKEADIDDTRKVVLRIRDHVALAIHQYEMLKQSDDEYDAKFKKRISTFKDEMSKEMNTQMITMVGIFTALAFLIFGSISSLDGIFENIDFPLFKVMSIGLIWGICVSNMIFVFLYCIGKMTRERLNFKSTDDPNAGIIQKYPVVFWTNLILISLLALSVWGYFVQHNEMGTFVVAWFDNNPVIMFWIGTAVILAITILAFIWLAQRTGVIKRKPKKIQGA